MNPALLVDERAESKASLTSSRLPVERGYGHGPDLGRGGEASGLDGELERTPLLVQHRGVGVPCGHKRGIAGIVVAIGVALRRGEGVKV